MCVAVGANMVITGERILSMGEFHRGPYRTAAVPRRCSRRSASRCTRTAQLAANACAPVSDQRGSAHYKRHVAGVLTERALRRATARAQHREEER